MWLEYGACKFTVIEGKIGGYIYLGPWPDCAGSSLSYTRSNFSTSCEKVLLAMLVRMAEKKLSSTWWLWICRRVHASISFATRRCWIYAR